MPWNRNAPDPLEARRRELAERERLLSEQRRRLTDQLSANLPAASAKPAEPLVWRHDEDSLQPRVAEATPARKRNLARQRQRDRFLFFTFTLLLIVLVIVLWVAYRHNTASGNGT